MSPGMGMDEQTGQSCQTLFADLVFTLDVPKRKAQVTIRMGTEGG
jgi:hypothetical protein